MIYISFRWDISLSLAYSNRCEFHSDWHVFYIKIIPLNKEVFKRVWYKSYLNGKKSFVSIYYQIQIGVHTVIMGVYRDWLGVYGAVGLTEIYVTIWMIKLISIKKNWSVTVNIFVFKSSLVIFFQFESLSGQMEIKLRVNLFFRCALSL
jgi:hypothetical protein